MALTKPTSEQVTFLQSGAGAVMRDVDEKLKESVSVKDFGAIGDGVTDDTVAIQAALDAAKGADNTGLGRTVFSLYFPNVPGGFYKITDTLVIDGTHGLHIHGDGAFSKRNNYPSTDAGALIRWYGSESKPVFQVRGQTGALSNPDFLIKISDLTISGYATAVTPTSGIPATMALSGIHIGNTDLDVADNTMARMVEISNVVIHFCRFGIWSGNPDGLNTDHASVNIENSLISGCPQAGVLFGTGNSVGSISGCHVVNNGWGSASFPADNYSTQRGANIHLVNGYLDLLSLTTAGSGDYKPVDADVFQTNGRVSIINAWSDTHGYFLYQVSAAALSVSGRQVGQITGVRHWESSMDASNTPNSMRIVAPGTVVSACSVYGNIEVVSGLAGKPVFIGIQFGRTGATFTGSGIETQRSLIDIGHGSGNFAQIAMGGRNNGVALSHMGRLVPHLLSMGASITGDAISILQALGPATTDSGLSMTLDPNSGALEIYANCYVYDASFNMRAHKAGRAYRIVLGSSSTALRVFVAEFADTTTSILYSAFTDIGGLKVGNSSGTFTEAVLLPPLRASAPSFSSGNWWEGGIYYNTTTNKLQVNTGGSTWVDLH